MMRLWQHKDTNRHICWCMKVNHWIYRRIKFWFDICGIGKAAFDKFYIVLLVMYY